MTVCGEKVTGVCVAEKCQHFKRCCPTVWDKYGKIKPLTNEEWIKSANTEQLAEAITDFIKRMANAEEVELNTNKVAWVRWLKQPHTPFS